MTNDETRISTLRSVVPRTASVLAVLVLIAVGHTLHLSSTTGRMSALSHAAMASADANMHARTDEMPGADHQTAVHDITLEACSIALFALAVASVTPAVRRRLPFVVTRRGRLPHAPDIPPPRLLVLA